jgi:hypothetical protein
VDIYSFDGVRVGRLLDERDHELLVAGRHGTLLHLTDDAVYMRHANGITLICYESGIERWTSPGGE